MSKVKGWLGVGNKRLLLAQGVGSVLCVGWSIWRESVEDGRRPVIEPELPWIYRLASTGDIPPYPQEAVSH